MKSVACFLLFLAFASAEYKRYYSIEDACKTKIKDQIDTEMHASLVYMNMAAYFGRNEVARPGIAKFFKEQSDEEREHAWKFIEYLNKRGEHMQNFAISMPAIYSWSSPLSALSSAIALEHTVNSKIHNLHNTADETCKDPHLMDFLEGFMSEQIESIDQLNRYVTELTKMNDGQGEFLFDSKLSKKEL